MKKKGTTALGLLCLGVCPLSEHVQVVGSWGERGTTDSGVYRSSTDLLGESNISWGGGGGREFRPLGGFTFEGGGGGGGRVFPYLTSPR